MKIKEIIKIIQADGWTLNRTKGSHKQFKHPNKPGLVTISGKLSCSGYFKQCFKTGRVQKMKKYLIILEKTDTGYSAYLPDLDGCIATGKSKPETLKNLKEALSFHLEGLKETGELIPEPKSTHSFLEIQI